MSCIGTLQQDKKVQRLLRQLKDIKEKFRTAHDDAIQSQQLKRPKIVDQMIKSMINIILGASDNMDA